MASNRVPEYFPDVGDAALRTYDFADAATGGSLTFYAGRTVDGYRLSTLDFYTNNKKHTNNTTTATTYTLVSDIDFDVTLKKPMIIDGTAIINVSYSCACTVNNANGYVVVKVRKWDGTTETNLVTSSNSTVSTSSGTTHVPITGCLDVTVPRTTFRQGETLRITVEGWLKADSGGGTADLSIYHDPKNRAADGSGGATVDTTMLLAQMPVKVDL